MNANHSPARRATPFFIFRVNKGIQSIHFYVVKIFKETRPVFEPVAFIQLLHSLAGILFALKAKPGPHGSQLRAIDNDTSCAISWLGSGDATSHAFVLWPEVSMTYTAVHTAGSDKLPFLSQWVCCHYKFSISIVHHHFHPGCLRRPLHHHSEYPFGPS
jgi:hypothetical protein